MLFVFRYSACIWFSVKKKGFTIISAMECNILLWFVFYNSVCVRVWLSVRKEKFCDKVRDGMRHFVVLFVFHNSVVECGKTVESTYGI